MFQGARIGFPDNLKKPPEHPGHVVGQLDLPRTALELLPRQLLIERLEVERTQAGRNVVHFRMKLHLPRLVEGMEQRVMAVATATKPAMPVPARGTNFEADVDFSNAARGEVEILAPFWQVVRLRGTLPGTRMELPAERLKQSQHPIHEIRGWQKKLENGQIENRAALAKKLGVSRAAVTKTLKMLRLAPEIGDFLATLTTPAEIRHFSLTRMRTLAELPLTRQREIFAKLKKAVVARVA